MKVCLASFHCCIRVVKEMIALNKAGVETITLCHHMANADLQSLHQSIVYYTDQYDYRAKLERLRDIQLIHVHNEPDWLGRVARNSRPDLPVVFDAHDLNSVRLGWVEEDEAFVFKHCDGFIFPSQGYYDLCVSNFGLNPDACAVILSMNSEDHIINVPKARMNGIVYEGGLSAPSPEEQGSIDYMARDMREVCGLSFRHGIPFVIFGANGEYVNHYVPTGAMCLPPSHYEYMMSELSRFDWGFIGNTKTCSQRKYAMPNKLFEYVAAGIPVIVMNAEECGEFVEKNEIGIHVRSFKELLDRYDEHKRLREIVKEKKSLLTMESQIDEIFKVYDEARREHEDEIQAGRPFLVGASGLGQRRGRVCSRTEGCRCAFCEGVSRKARV